MIYQYYFSIFIINSSSGKINLIRQHHTTTISRSITIRRKQKPKLFPIYIYMHLCNKSPISQNSARCNRNNVLPHRVTHSRATPSRMPFVWWCWTEKNRRHDFLLSIHIYTNAPITQTLMCVLRRVKRSVCYRSMGVDWVVCGRQARMFVIYTVSGPVVCVMCVASSSCCNLLINRWMCVCIWRSMSMWVCVYYVLKML